MTIGTGFMIVATTMPMNMMLEKMSLGMIETVKIFVLTLLFSLPFGLVVATIINPVPIVIFIYLQDKSYLLFRIF